MILATDNDNMVNQPLLQDAPQDSPPAYDASPEPGLPYSGPPKSQKDDLKVQSNPLLQSAGPSYTYTDQPMFAAPPMVYNYVNPQSGEQIVSLLPPNHPEMVCLQSGAHIPHTHYGILGILAAVFWFPLGVGLCLLDKRVRCRRCGLVIEDGICG